MARIVGHLSIAELEARYRAAQDATEARHFQAIWLLAQGRTALEVAEVLAFVPRWVTQLAVRYNASGPEALGDRRRRNGKAVSLLSGDVLSALAERVRTPPEDGGLWSGPKVAAWMARHLGQTKVHPQRGGEARARGGGAPPGAPPGGRATSARGRCTRSAAGRRCGGSAGRPRRRGRGIRALRGALSGLPSKGGRRGGGGGRVGGSPRAPRPGHPRAAGADERAAFKRGSTRRFRGPRRRIPTGRSRSGPRTRTAPAWSPAAGAARRSPAPRRRIPAGRSSSGPRTSPASA